MPPGENPDGPRASNDKREDEPKMKLNLKALTLAAAVLSGAALLLAGLANLLSPGYGRAFLALASSVYPGYQASGSFADLLVGTLYAVVDGALFGWVFGWLYNRIAAGRSTRAPVRKAKEQRPVEP
jgi:hypothetical protein